MKLNYKVGDNKLEIIDDELNNCYVSKLYVWKDVSKWYQFKKYNWSIQQVHHLGKNYMCPEIYNKKIKIKDYFERDVSYILKDSNDKIKLVKSITIKNTFNNGTSYFNATNNRLF